MAEMGTDSKPSRPITKWVLYALSALFAAGGVTLLILLYTTSGAALKDKAFSGGQQARINLETRAVEGNLPTVTPPTPPKEAASPEEVPVTEETPAETPPVEDMAPVEDAATAPSEEGAEDLGSEAALLDAAPEEATAIPETPIEDQLPPPNVTLPLKGALNSSLQEKVKGVGTLPAISKSGEESWQYYGKQDNSDTAKPAIAIVVTGLGLSHIPTGKALRLPENITLSFSPYAGQLQQQITRARTYGHEVWLDLPLEPETYPASDAGPLTLLKDLPEEEVIKRLHTVLAGATTYVGLVGSEGEVFSDYAPMRKVAKELKSRGLLLMLRSEQYAEAETADHIQYVSRTLDTLPEGKGAGAEQLLTELEAVAKESGHAIGVLSDSPQIYELISQWSASLEGKGLTLVPATAIIARQKP